MADGSHSSLAPSLRKPTSARVAARRRFLMLEPTPTLRVLRQLFLFWTTGKIATPAWLDPEKCLFSRNMKVLRKKSGGVNQEASQLYTLILHANRKTSVQMAFRLKWNHQGQSALCSSDLFQRPKDFAFHLKCCPTVSEAHPSSQARRHMAPRSPCRQGGQGTQRGAHTLRSAA